MDNKRPKMYPAAGNIIEFKTVLFVIFFAHDPLPQYKISPSPGREIMSLYFIFINFFFFFFVAEISILNHHLPKHSQRDFLD